MNTCPVNCIVRLLVARLRTYILQCYKKQATRSKLRRCGTYAVQGATQDGLVVGGIVMEVVPVFVILLEAIYLSTCHDGGSRIDDVYEVRQVRAHNLCGDCIVQANVVVCVVVLVEGRGTL